MSRQPTQLLLNLAIAAIATVVAFVAIEGLASTVMFVREWFGGSASHPAVAESTHTRYDAEIGWVNIPGAVVEDLYAPGASLRINSQGFRNDEDVSKDVPPGHFRVICSGDSFTLGFGVANDQTWCHRLTIDGFELETVNMGQGGYGIDQAWLWYKRDGITIDHQLLVFAFIHPDFNRMTRLSLRSYGKPRVRVADGGFEIENVPVPRAGALNGWLRRHRDTFGSLRVFQLLGPWLSRPLPEPEYDRFPPYHDRYAFGVSLAIFGDLSRTLAEAGGRAVFVYLPSEFDTGARAPNLADFRRRLAEQARGRGLWFLDLSPEFQALSDSEVDALFFDSGETHFKHAKGHYTPAGNAFVAGLLSQKLSEGLADRAQ